MLKPRNTLVDVELVETQKLPGGIVVPDDFGLYAEGIIRGIGPGNINAAGARTETHDLAVGDRVLVKRYQVSPQGAKYGKAEAGVRFTRNNVTHILFEQTYILAIIEHAGVKETFDQITRDV